ncbi:TetR/AcrR family transcriptional regulator [Aquihabitans sp. McL0605]|uniref:TetR/AcrR family transcriptional regulator n=1 Tax=Aquihabitans sp. McL0605 TaxID=3415671 RepID=UPI003CE84700
MSGSTRDRILDAALAAFATRGVDGTPITDLEEAAGLASGSGGFYRYFRTKDEALAAVVRREIDNVQIAHDGEPPALDPEADLRSAVRLIIEEGLHTLHALGPLLAIMAREQGRIPELASEVSEQLVEGGLRHDAVRISGLLGDDDPTAAHRVMAVVLSSIIGYTLATEYFGTPPGGVDRAQYIDTVTDLVAPPPRD